MLYRGYILIFIGLLEIILGLWLLLRYKRTAVNSWYSSFVFSVAGWVLANAGIYFFTNNMIRAHLYNQLTWMAGVLIAGTFLFFSWYFPVKVMQVKSYYALLLILPLIFFGYLIFFTKSFQTGMSFVGNNQQFFNGPLFFLFPVFFLLYWFWAIRNFIIKFKITDGIHIYQLKLLLWGVGVSSVFIIIFDIIYPLMGKAVVAGLGPEASIIWLGFTSYVIFGRK